VTSPYTFVSVEGARGERDEVLEEEAEEDEEEEEAEEDEEEEEEEEEEAEEDEEEEGTTTARDEGKAEVDSEAAEEEASRGAVDTFIADADEGKADFGNEEAEDGAEDDSVEALRELASLKDTNEFDEGMLFATTTDDALSFSLLLLTGTEDDIELGSASNISGLKDSSLKSSGENSD
jgi:hypothetical protein